MKRPHVLARDRREVQLVKLARGLGRLVRDLVGALEKALSAFLDIALPRERIRRPGLPAEGPGRREHERFMTRHLAALCHHHLALIEFQRVVDRPDPHREGPAFVQHHDQPDHVEQIDARKRRLQFLVMGRPPLEQLYPLRAFLIVGRQHLLDLHLDLVELKGLVQERDHAAAAFSTDIVRMKLAAHEDKVRGGRQAAHVVKQIESVHRRHQDVRDDQIEVG